MRCPACGVHSSEDSRFCQVCGHRFPGPELGPPSAPPSGGKTDTLVLIVVLVVVVVFAVGGTLAVLLLRDWDFDRAYYSDEASMEVTSARWENLDRYGLPPKDGWQWLWLDFILVNEGSDDRTIND